MIMQQRNNIRVSARYSWKKFAVLAAATGLLGASSLTRAANVSWDPTSSSGANPGGGGNWDTTDPFWYNGTADVAWNNANNDTAVFSGTAGIVTLTAPITAGGLTFSTTGYTIGGSSTLTLAGTSPTVTLSGGEAETISSVIAGSSPITVTGSGQLTLSGNNTFSGGMTISSGAQVNFSSEATGNTQMGPTGKTVTLDGGTLNYTGTTPTNAGSPWDAFAVTANGGTINFANSGNAGNGAKFNVNTSSLTGSGVLNITGQGIFTTNGTETGFTGTVNVNGGWVELNSATGLGSTAAIINVNTGGEFAIKAASTAYNLNVNGGVVGADGASGTYVGGTLTFSGNSSIRLGYFYANTNNNLTVGDALAGSGTITLLNGLNWNTTAATYTEGASTGNQLILSGNNSAFTGTLVVDGNHAVVFNNTSAYLTNGTLSGVTTLIGGGNALPIVGLNFVTSTMPNITDNTGGAGGVLALDGQSNYNAIINMASVANGTWFLGSIGSSTYTASSLGVGANNTYYLGGSGTLTIPNSILTGSAAVVVGSSIAPNTGTVVFTTNQTYTGGTTINGGTLQLGTGGTTGNVAGSITINSGGTLAYDHSDNISINSPLSGTGAISNIGTGSLTFNAANTLSLTVSGMENIGASGSFIAPTLTLAGGTVNLLSPTNNDTFTTTVVNPGASMIAGGFANSSGTFALGAITHNSGGTVNFAPLTSGTITTTTGNTNGILGGWATYQGTTWAMNDGSGNIVAFPSASYVADAWAAANNTDDTTNDSPASGSTTNSVRFNTSGANTLTLAGTNTITTGGILETANVGANAVTITGGTLQAGGTNDLVINQFNTSGAMTISSLIAGSHGLTKSGPGTLVLADTAANTFTGNVYINGGALAYTADNNLGAAANQIYLNSGGVLDFAAGANISITRTINVGASGGGIEVAVSGDGGASTGGKLTMGTANQLTGLGTITYSGLGILTISAANNSYSGAGWIINGGATPAGVVELKTVNGLGTNAVPVTINANGELATNVAVANPITLNGGTISGETASGTFTGPINVTANSGIRTGLFYSGGNVNLTFSSPISGSGNITLLNGQTWGPSTNPVPTQIAGDGHYLTLTGDLNGTYAGNTAYTGTINVGGGQGLYMNGVVPAGQTNAGTAAADISIPHGNGSTPGIAASASTTGIPLIGIGIGSGGNNLAAPAITDNTGAAGGVFAINGGANITTPYTPTIDLSALYNGNWFLGSISGSVYEGGTINPGNGNLYRLGGGGGTLYLYNEAGADLTGSANVQIGDNMANGGGTVVFVTPMSYTGNTAIVNGTLAMGNYDIPGQSDLAEQDDSMPTTGTVTFGGVNGTTQYSGTLDLQGDKQDFYTPNALQIANGANPATQVITNNVGNRTGYLIIHTDNGSSEWDGVIKDGVGPVGLTVTGASGNGLTVTGNNNYSGLTTIDNDQYLKVGNGGATGAITGPVQFNNANSTLIINTSNSFTNNGAITGPGTIVQNGAGTVTFTNATSTYSGGTFINNGKILAVQNGTLGSGMISLNGGKLSLGPTSIPSNNISGFGTNGAGWQVNNNGISSTPITNNVLTLTDGALNEARSAFYTTPLPITDQYGFTTTFTYTPTYTGTPADGMAFVVQNNGPTAIGSTGGNLGYGAGQLTQSGALEVNIFPSSGKGAQGTVFATDGALGTIVATTPVNLDTSGHAFKFTLTYNGQTDTLSEQIVDTTASPNLTYNTTWTGVDFPTILGASTGYVGFTGGTGGSTATQTISNFTFTDTAPPPTYNTAFANAVDVAANSISAIESNAVAASLAQVTLEAGSTLNVTSSAALSAGTAYTLTLNSAATTTGTVTINVADNGAGKGTVVLSTLAGSSNITKGGTGILDLPSASSLPSILTINGGVVSMPYTGTSPVSSIVADIKAAYDLGKWDKTNAGGPTITTTAATKLGTTLGYLDTGTAVDVMYTWYGDLNLDGVVNSTDLTLMTAGNGSSWNQGDLNYDGKINADDWSLFFLGDAAQDGSIPAGVPEPTTLALFVAAGALALRRRRRD